MISASLRNAGVAAGLCCAALFAAVAAAPATAAEADPAAWMYEPGTVALVDLTLPRASEEALEADPDEYQPGTFSLTVTDGTPGGPRGAKYGPLNVGIRLKGGAGSFVPLPGKAGFKLKFNFSVNGQKFLGLKKMTLNNMVQDPSMIAETLAYQAFRAAGVPGSRSGYAYVRLNGGDYGLYLNLETLDDVALKKRFGAVQHLYEGSYGADLTPGGEGAFEVDEGSATDTADLSALIAAVGDLGAGSFSTRLAARADLEEMTRMWAVEKYIGHWDGYSGEDEEEPLLPNNYYLYSDVAGRFQMLPWGTDQTWGAPLHFDGRAGLLFNDCLADPSCAGLYRQALRQARAALDGLGLDGLATRTAALLKPWQQLDPKRPYDLGEIDFGVALVRAFIANRPGQLSAWLATQPSDGAVSAAGQPAGGEPSGGSANPSPTQARRHGAQLPKALRIAAAHASRGVLSARLELPTRGRVELRAFAIYPGARSGCGARVRAVSPGSLSLHCRLPAAVRSRLAGGRLRFRLEASLTRSGAAEESASRVFSLAESGAARQRHDAP